MIRFSASCILCFCIGSSLAADEQRDPIVHVGSAELNLRFDSEFSEAQRIALASWIERRSKIVADYYGQFPVKRSAIQLQSVNGGGVRGGTTYPGSRPFIRLRVGREFTEVQLDRDWVLVHEMIHLALPHVDDEQLWLAEGLSTYVESVARSRMSDMQREQLWGDFIKSMPQGLPKEGDEGLDRTHTWGRTYWGGAIFCLVADVEIRKRSKNKTGLRDALRSVLKESGGFTVDWPVEKIFKVGDSATGQHTLVELYESMKDKPAAVDLASLWQQLGVSLNETKVEFDDTAPLASVRKAIEAM